MRKKCTPASITTADTNDPLASPPDRLDAPDIFEVDVALGGRLGLGAGAVPLWTPTSPVAVSDE